MDIGNIENYSFIHGLHRNMVNGKWFPLHPHTLGRPLTHSEMDYNLLYSQQTLAGWRIFGQNNDLTLADNELEKSLIFWKISALDTDYDRYVAAGYTSGQYIWITPQYDCNDFYVSFASKTNAIDNCGGFIITLASTTNATQIPDPTPIPTTVYSSGSGGGSGITPTATPIQPTSTSIPPTATAISSGGGSGDGGAGIPDPTATLDESIRPTPTATLDESIRPTPTPTDVEVLPDPTATEVIPTATPVPDPTATPVPDPTATEAIRPTATPIIDGRLNYEFIVCFNPEGKAQPNYICTAETLTEAGFTIIPPSIEDTITIDGELNAGAVYIFRSVTPSTDLSLERILTHNIFGCEGVRTPDPDPIDSKPTATPVPAPTATPIPDPTSTAIPAPTATPVPAPTATPIPDPTSTAIPAPTATPVPEPTRVPDPTELELISKPTSTPDSGSGGEAIRPTPTPEDLGKTGFCHFIFVQEGIITEGFGLSYELNGIQNSLFNELMAEPVEINGTRGIVYNICSTRTPSYWDSMNNFVMAYPEGVYALETGGPCQSNFDCLYNSEPLR